MIWGVLLRAQKLTFQTFAELRNDRRSTCCSADGLRKSSLTFWSAVEGWCDKPIWDRGWHLQTVHSLSSYLVTFLYLTHYNLLRKITCEEEWTLINPQSMDNRPCFRGQHGSVAEQSAVCRPIGKSLMNHITYMLLSFWLQTWTYILTELKYSILSGIQK